MSNIGKLVLGALLLCVSQVSYADCNDPDAPADCIEVIGDDDSFGGSGSGGGGSLGLGGDGSSGSGGSGGSGVGTGDGGSGNGKEEDDELEFKKCEQASKQKLEVCKTQASATFYETLNSECKGLGTITINLGFIIITIDEYAQCKDEAQSAQQNAERVCNVSHGNRVAACY